MYKMYYVLKDSSITLLRNKGAAFSKGFFSFVYACILTIVFRIWINLIHFESLEKQRALEAKHSTDSLLQTDSSDHLITLLTSLKISFMIFSLGLLLFGIALLCIQLQKNYLLNKKELLIKKMLGNSAVRVTSEFFFESFLLVIPCIILGMLLSDYLYLQFFHFATSWIAAVLYPPSYFLLFLTLPVIGIFLLILVCQFLYLKQKITKL
ncbi:FtsX-like permease family protein [Candidatus Enterococcus mansonii]|uniref:ABC3 transporter permease C-terminal domain-containing protein n=1 Tax=Candidatus Enterococcus mansonii TaxID=1834181 RepID=A0A242C663_9ENTE|nr:FtsX-like permease family protein [Enterococcus sp. 4G2_DIV0659]OTO05745.1 hypothetical protein A5880_002920 [Enterococcus sp. 4G2_DIV0659]